MSRTVRLILIVLFTLILCAVAPLIGPSFADDETMRRVLYTLRLPRAGAAFAAGATLALCGMVFQSLFRNDLASPYTLGVSGGASFGAALAILLGLPGLFGIPGVPLAAFCGALVSVVIVWRLSLVSHRAGSQTMLLAGVAVGFFFSGLTVLVQYLADYSHSYRILHWLMGSLDSAGSGELLKLAPFVPVSCLAALFHRELDLMSLGEETSAARGLDPKKMSLLLFALTSVAVAGVVAVTGPIGFVGLMAPHIARMLVGPSHRLLGPATFFTGGALLVLCDTVARVLIAPAEIPVGVITALLGGPFFLWLLLRRDAQ